MVRKDAAIMIFLRLLFAMFNTDFGVYAFEEASICSWSTLSNHSPFSFPPGPQNPMSSLCVLLLWFLWIPCLVQGLALCKIFIEVRSGISGKLVVLNEQKYFVIRIGSCG